MSALDIFGSAVDERADELALPDLLGAAPAGTFKPASPKAYRLTDAVMEMTERYGLARQMAAHAFSRGMYATSAEQVEAARVDEERWNRTATHRYRALRRLTDALRDLGGAS